jgi:hypothetical protein
MKKLLTISLILFTITFLIIYFKPSNNTIEVNGDTVADILKKELSGKDNIVVHTLYKFDESKIVLYSYDFVNMHFLGYRFVENNQKELNLLGGSEDIVDQSVRVTFSNGFYDNQRTIITYGEIYDPTIEKIKIYYNDNSNIIVPNTKNAYVGVKSAIDTRLTPIKIEGIDKQSKIVYTFPQ